MVLIISLKKEKEMENNASNVEIVRTNKKKLRDVEEDLENLKKLNVVVYSVTCDGINLF
ncbi:hypothetical protein ACIRNY_09210 [Capnocytophaga canimorsus]|uniref:hypothetical protein n=1 Tax=Capnocytophaga canimorsus TaxID=28188 RepID=UPI00384D82EF